MKEYPYRKMNEMREILEVLRNFLSNNIKITSS